MFCVAVLNFIKCPAASSSVERAHASDEVRFYASGALNKHHVALLQFINVMH